MDGVGCVPRIIPVCGGSRVCAHGVAVLNTIGCVGFLAVCVRASMDHSLTRTPSPPTVDRFQGNLTSLP
ncbi:unnamed protein product [Musa textilis]